MELFQVILVVMADDGKDFLGGSDIIVWRHFGIDDVDRELFL
jgi:hypothetical protein